MAANPSINDETKPASIPDAVWESLACSQCGGRLVRLDQAQRCEDCRTIFEDTPEGALDLRLRRPKHRTVEFRLGAPLVPAAFDFARLQARKDPDVDFSGREPPWHFTRELLTWIPRAKSPSSVALDLGCGNGLHSEICQHAGFQWAGLDYAHPRAPILGDGHALPFRSNSIEFVLSMAVLEHIRFPFLLACEVMRVLKPGGCYLGTVAFLEPFHGDSYYHHTHLGTYNTLDSAGFEVVRVGPNARWSGLQAQATMSLFPRLPARMSKAIVWPVGALHKLWWRAGRRFSASATESLRQLSTAGSFEFVARKPD